MDIDRVLITYVSGHGSTFGIAEKVAETFRGTGAVVDVIEANAAPTPTGYDAVVIGSAIRYDTWMPSAKAYVRDHESALSVLPVAYFFSCMALSKPAGHARGQAYSDTIAALSPVVLPVCTGRFAGALDFKNFSVLMRVPARLLFTLLGVKSGDYRDDAAIRKWSAHCLSALHSQIKDQRL